MSSYEAVITLPYVTSTQMRKIFEINNSVGLEIANNQDFIRATTPENTIKLFAIEKWNRENGSREGFISHIGEISFSEDHVNVKLTIEKDL